MLAACLGWPRWQIRRSDQSGTGRTVLLAALPVVIAFSVNGWWVHHSDSLENSNPFSGFLTSTEMVKWNWGPAALRHRLTADFWNGIWDNFSQLVLSEPSLVLLLLGLTLAPALLRRSALSCAGFFLLSVLVFSTLFFHHDYYTNVPSHLDYRA